MDGTKLIPNEPLGEFDGPDGEQLALVVSRTGRSVAVRDKNGSGIRRTVARISHPLSDAPRIDLEDWWRARSTAWRASLKSMALHALRDALPGDGGTESSGSIRLEPASLLGSFMGPEERHQIVMTVARTGRSVAARLGDSGGQIIARAHRPTCVDPGIAFEGLYRHNPADWQQEFTARFSAALEAAVAALVDASQMAEAGR
jgi:hypothetical protein